MELFKLEFHLCVASLKALRSNVERGKCLTKKCEGVARRQGSDEHAWGVRIGDWLRLVVLEALACRCSLGRVQHSVASVPDLPISLADPRKGMFKGTCSFKQLFLIIKLGG